jgi:hypothetical protein
MGLALTIEKMSGFSGAFALALFWLFATTDIGASLVATDDLLFGSSDWFCVSFCHFQVSLGSTMEERLAGSLLRRANVSPALCIIAETPICLQKAGTERRARRREAPALGYSHTQKAPLGLILYGSALACIIVVWMIGETQGICIAGGVNLLIALIPPAFDDVNVVYLDEVLATLFGPISVFRRTLRMPLRRNGTRIRGKRASLWLRLSTLYPVAVARAPSPCQWF